MKRLLAVYMLVYALGCSFLSFAQKGLEVQLQKGHNKQDFLKGYYKVCAISHDSRWAISYSNTDYSIVIWDLFKSNIYARYRLLGPVSYAVFLKNNRYVLINNKYVIDIASGKTLNEIPVSAFQYEVKTDWDFVKNATSCKVVLPTSRSGYIDSLIKEYDHHDSYRPKVYCLAPDSSLLWGAKDGSMYCYDTKQRKVIKVTEPAIGDIHDIFYNATAKKLACVGDNATQIYDQTTGKKTALKGRIYNFDYTLNFTYGCGQTENPDKIVFWNLSDEPRIIYSVAITKKNGALVRTDVDLLNDGTAIIATEGKPLEKINLVTGSLLWRDSETFSYYDWSDNRKYLTVLYQTFKKKIYDTKTMHNIIADIGATDLSKNIIESAISPDNKYLMYCTDARNQFGYQYILYDLIQKKVLSSDFEKRIRYLRDSTTYASDAIKLFFLQKPNEILFYRSGTADILRYDIATDSLTSYHLSVPFSYSSTLYNDQPDYLIVANGGNHHVYETSSFTAYYQGEEEQFRVPVRNSDSIFILTKNDADQYVAYLRAVLKGQVIRYPITGNLKAININRNGTKLAYCVTEHTGGADRATMKIVDWKTLSVTDSVVLPAETVYTNGNLVFDPTDRLLYLGLDKLYQYDLTAHTLNSRWNNRVKFIPVNTNDDGKYLIGYQFSDRDNSSLTVMDLDSQKVISSVQSLYRPYSLESLTSSLLRSYPQIYTDSSNSYLSVSDAKPLWRGPENVLHPNWLYEEGFTSEKDFFVSMSASGEVEMYGAKKFNLLNTIRPFEYGTIGFTNNKKYAYTKLFSGADELKVYDVPNGFKKIPFIHTKGIDGEFNYFDNQRLYFGQRMELSANGRFLAVLNSYPRGFLKVYDFEESDENEKHPELLSCNDENLALKGELQSLDDVLHDLIITDDEKKTICATYCNYLIRASIQNGKIEKLLYPQDKKVKFWNMVAGYSGSFVMAFVTDSDKRLPVKLVLWDEKGNHKIISSYHSEGEAVEDGTEIYENRNMFSIRRRDGLHFFDLRTGARLKDIIDPDINSFNVKDGSVFIHSALQGRYVLKLPSFTRNDSATEESGYYFSYDGTFQYVMHDTSVLAKFVFDNTNDELLWFAGDKYYFAGKASKDALIFRYKNDIFPASVFDPMFNRPDTIFSLLKPAFNIPDTVIHVYRAAYTGRPGKVSGGTSPGDYLVNAEVTSVSTLGKPIITNTDKYAVSISLANAHSDRYRLRIKINGISLFGVRGMPVSEANPIQLVDIPLLPGNNFIVADFINADGVASLPASLMIHYSQENQPVESKLYFIGIGASDYKKDTTQNLLYAKKDIEDIAKQLTERNPNTVTYTVMGKNVCKDSILALRQKLLHTHPADKIILCYSGHGIISAGNYYLGTYEMDFAKAEENGLSVEVLYDLLDSIPARNRFILLDACKSGQDYEKKTDGIMEARPKRELNISDIYENVFADYGNAYGIDVIAATRGTSNAFQPDSLKNSLLSAAFLQGVSSNLDNSVKQGNISVKKLKEYITDLVFKWTSGLQIPTTRNENVFSDWRF